MQESRPNLGKSSDLLLLFYVDFEKIAHTPGSKEREEKCFS
jgi:hypothetical protein